ncbi:uncharacterized protein LOC734599 [Xenopus laevis]|uniref:MGC115598 protein n=1 Tax=Xenopus laevis TaxID=8355 RepID=Q4V7L1_XENLA|nr:uncharacterized protein LOC734599 [Xenopus laevis]AAH97851.1 MGC115598 protein [Xenopus laevis]
MNCSHQKQPMERSRRAGTGANQSRMEASEDYVCQLADELALRILWYLDGKEILQVAQTCQRWRQLAEDEGLWQGKCKARGIEEPLYISSATGSTSPWKSTYIRQLRIHNNWCLGRYRKITLELSKEDPTFLCLEYDGKQLVGTTHYDIIKIWSAVTGKCLKTLVGHRAEVCDIQMRGDIIVSGSDDLTLKVWNVESGECIRTLRGHRDSVSCLHLHEQQAVSGSCDYTIRVWNIETGRCLHILTGHSSRIIWVCYDGRRVASEDMGARVKIWNPETETCLHSYNMHNINPPYVQFDGTHVVSQCKDKSVLIWDVETGKCIFAIAENKTYSGVMAMKNNILILGTDGHTAEIWDVKTRQRLNVLQGSQGIDVRDESLEMHRDFVISRTPEGNLSLWNWRTGEFLHNLFVSDAKETRAFNFRISDTKCVYGVAEKQRHIPWPSKVEVLDFDVE